MRSVFILVLALASILVFSAFFDASTAFAQSCPNAGNCPPGTCANRGGTRACDVSKCSARNCGKMSKTTFCRNYRSICWRTCPVGDCSAECASRYSNCLRTGCFRFDGRPGTQCLK